jgi:hypothetical protein
VGFTIPLALAVTSSRRPSASSASVWTISAWDEVFTGDKGVDDLLAADTALDDVRSDFTS